MKPVSAPPEGSPRWLAITRGGSGSEWREGHTTQEDLDRIRTEYGGLPDTIEEYRAHLHSLNRPDLGGVDWLWQYVKRGGPKGWFRMGINAYGAKYRNRPDLDGSLVVHVDGRWYDDARWIHMSAATSYRTPTWEELTGCKRDFVGEDLYAYSVIPPRQFYVNISPWQLHLWVPLDGTPLPEFSGGFTLL